MILPKAVKRVLVPPIKCQGIKTKLVRFLCENITWSGQGRWIEPFLGSGVVLFNVNPKRAVVSDTNLHVINLYREIQNGQMTGPLVKAYLEEQGQLLSQGGQTYYNQVRERFNSQATSLDFLFLNRSCFNGMMRFNRKGQYNVPYGHKPERFSKAYVTKIANQVDAIALILRDKQWEFRVRDWREALGSVHEDDFVYLDPPYVGRYADYFNQWTAADAVELAAYTRSLPSGFAVSMWLENQYRHNHHVDEHWAGLTVRTESHFYHLGATQSLRHAMKEGLILGNRHR